jgi:hypothetical protein
MIAPMALGDGSRPASAIYGTIVVLGVIAGVSEDADAGPAAVLGGVLVTALAFWAAHVYAEVLAARLADPERRWGEIMPRAAAGEWPIVEAALAPAVALVLGVIGVLSRDTAIDVAMALALADLFGWGVVIGRASGQSRAGVLLSGLLNVALGGVVVFLKVLVH